MAMNSSMRPLQRGKPPLVLVVDDARVARLLISETLQQAGFAVVEAENGRVALQVFAEQSPDILLLDVEMPELDGFATCAALRKLPNGAHIPVLMVTGLEDVTSIQRAFEAGATDFVTKPVNLPLLGHRVRYMLRASAAVQSLRRSEDKNSALLRAIPDMMFRLTREGILVDLKGARGFRPLVRKGKIRGAALHSLLPAALAARALDKISVVLRTRHPQHFEFQMALRDGSRHCEARLVACGEDEVLAIVRDITDRKSAEARIRFLAYYDEVTGLPNRQLFHETLNHTLGRARRYQHLAAVLFLDVDRFKRVNDTLGHRTGDLLLQEVAARIATSVRDTDAVARFEAGASSQAVARLGGDEFTVLLTEIQRAEDAALVARRIRESFAEPFTVDGHQLYTTCSIGIAVCPADGEDADTLLKNADTAMYHAKETGRNNYQFYSASMNASALERLSLETMLRHALERDELQLYYQPQINLDSGEISGVEALLRWQHPELGLISAGPIIPVAEETGLIVPIGEWALRTACAQNKAWQDAGLRPIRVAVNLSPQQFCEVGLSSMIEAVLTDTGLRAEYLEIEITESTAMAHAERTIATLSRLKAIGIALAVDDFGTGYSSLSYLKRFPLDTLKIDRTFVRDLASDADDAAIATAILALGRALHLNVVAEGVETEEQLEVLRREGCDAVQGYLFAWPAPAEEIVAALAETASGPPRQCVLPAQG